MNMHSRALRGHVLGPCLCVVGIHFLPLAYDVMVVTDVVCVGVFLGVHSAGGS